MSQVKRSRVTPSTPYDALPEWLNITEVATYWNCSKWFVYKGIDRGDIPHRRIGHRVIHIPKQFFHPDTATRFGAAR